MSGGIDWLSTVFSDCGVYRYTLYRPAPSELRGRPPLLGCWLNPSTAGAEKNDATTHRIMKFRTANGYGDYMAVNAFAFRSPHPAVMMKHPEPVGPDNDHWINRAVEWCRSQDGTVVVGWGNDGAHLDREKEVLALLDMALHCFGLTKAGQPHFPTPFIQPYRLQKFRHRIHPSWDQDQNKHEEAAALASAGQGDREDHED